jgi:phage terminase large subunit-like protein
MPPTPGPRRAKTGPKAATAALDLSAAPSNGGGQRAVWFIQRFLHVPAGADARELFRLRGWQREIVHGLFDDPRPRQGLVSIPRGNGKTTLAASLGLYGLLGDGAERAQVLAVASDARQAKITLEIARRMVELSPELAAAVQVYKDRLYCPPTDSTFMALPADPGALQGWDPSLAIVDELHVVTDDVYTAMAAAAGKRPRSLLLAISTPAGDTDSVMWRLVQRGRGGGAGFFFREYAAADGCDLDDEAAWEQANPALRGPDPFLHRDGLADSLQALRETAFRRYRLGQWVEQVEESWLPPGAWERCGDSRAIPDNADVVLGFDGSFSGDTTALVACQIGERPHLAVAGFWEAPEGARDWRVSILGVEQAIRDCCARWQVREVIADPFRWARSLQVLAGEGLPVLEFPQSPERMSPATSRLHEAVTNHAVTHSGDPRLARHMGNAVLRTSARGAQLAKEHKHSRRRIDLAVAAVMAHDRACQLAADDDDYDLMQSVW